MARAEQLVVGEQVRVRLPSGTWVDAEVLEPAPGKTRLKMRARDIGVVLGDEPSLWEGDVTIALPAYNLPH
jgi:hypothetical protein